METCDLTSVGAAATPFAWVLGDAFTESLPHVGVETAFSLVKGADASPDSPQGDVETIVWESTCSDPLSASPQATPVTAPLPTLSVADAVSAVAVAVDAPPSWPQALGVAASVVV